jgi:ABC-2 type transport system permease protein
MTAVVEIREPVEFRSDAVSALAVALATARAYLQRMRAYLIQFIRWPLGPLFMFATWRITYGVSGRTHVDGASLSGFLIVGIFGVILWSSSIWASGYALEWERGEGTSGSLLLTPSSRASVVAGYGLGSLVWFLPSFAGIALLGWLSGAQLHVSDGFALALSAASLVFASLAAGFFFSGLFILSRRGNLIANVLQTPIYLLSGMLVPLSLLPAWSLPLAAAIPATHAVVALRETSLTGASMRQVAEPLLLAFGVSLVWIVIGMVGLRRVENVAKRTGQLELF